MSLLPVLLDLQSGGVRLAALSLRGDIVAGPPAGPSLWPGTEARL